MFQKIITILTKPNKKQKIELTGHHRQWRKRRWTSCTRRSLRGNREHKQSRWTIPKAIKVLWEIPESQLASRSKLSEHLRCCRRCCSALLSSSKGHLYQITFFFYHLEKPLKTYFILPSIYKNMYVNQKYINPLYSYVFFDKDLNLWWKMVIRKGIPWMNWK